MSNPGLHRPKENCACGHSKEQHSFAGPCLSMWSSLMRCVCRRFYLQRPPLRQVVDHFSDWRGDNVELSCGHIIADIGNSIRRRCRPCLETGVGGEVVALHDIRCGCYRCNNREPKP